MQDERVVDVELSRHECVLCRYALHQAAMNKRKAVKGDFRQLAVHFDCIIAEVFDAKDENVQKALAPAVQQDSGQSACEKHAGCPDEGRN